jgi:hypothetical protein
MTTGRMLGGSESRAGSSAGKEEEKKAEEDGGEEAGDEVRSDLQGEFGVAAGPARKAGITTTSARMKRTRAKIDQPMTTLLTFMGRSSQNYSSYHRF